MIFVLGIEFLIYILINIKFNLKKYLLKNLNIKWKKKN